MLKRSIHAAICHKFSNLLIYTISLLAGQRKRKSEKKHVILKVTQT